MSKFTAFYLFQAMKPEGKMFNVPNLLTASNMLCGVFSIFCVLLGKFEWAPWFIFLGAIFDFLDGFMARILKQYSELGKQLDSLADMITFGLAPGVMMVAVIAAGIEMRPTTFGADISEHMVYVLDSWKLGLFHNSSMSFEGIYKYLPFLGLLIPVFSLFRLAKFNIDTRQSESFIGMPTPAVTLFFSTFALALWWYFSKDGYPSYFAEIIFQPSFLCGWVVLMSFSLISEIPLFALKFKHFKWKGNEIRYLFLLISLVLILTTNVWSIALIVFLYPVLSVVSNLPKNKSEKTNEI